MSWYLERNYDWLIRKKWYLRVVDKIICEGVMTDIARPQNEVLKKKPFVRLFDKFNFVFWLSKKYEVKKC